MLHRRGAAPHAWGDKQDPSCKNRIYVPASWVDKIPSFWTQSCQRGKYKAEIDLKIWSTSPRVSVQEHEQLVNLILEDRKTFEDDMAGWGGEGEWREWRSTCSKSQRSVQHPQDAMPIPKHTQDEPRVTAPFTAFGIHSGPCPHLSSVWHTGGSLPTHAGQLGFQQYD